VRALSWTADTNDGWWIRKKSLRWERHAIVGGFEVEFVDFFVDEDFGGDEAIEASRVKIQRVGRLVSAC